MADPTTPRALQLAEVPEHITRRQYKAMIELLGLDAEELISLAWHGNAIEAEVFALNVKGERYMKAGTDEIATHRVTIPILDPGSRE